MIHFNNLCKSIGKIQGIGKKTSLKMAYYLCYENKNLLEELVNSLENAKKNIKECSICGCLSENELCDYCVNLELDEIICLVESPKDVFFIDECNVYEGRYFILSKMNEYYLKKLEQMIIKFDIKELLLAYTPSVSTDTLCFYLEDYFKNYNMKISKIAQGVPNGIKIQDIDINSLTSAIVNKVNFDA
ncbi:recombination protein RecR [Campylobacter sp. Cr9]|uniref:recombination protein RecR n=1 Tax=unclassified Campylobacter TaxID=2593542 RepID=UPI001EFB4FC2|nr:recombination protein RecR [Campylobacter sp. RM5004]MBZ7985345.1 recombination protein RecR [Campylobacter sp. Cr9]ULO00851.1 recombination protein [Campylobacter sp. RM5004]